MRVHTLSDNIFQKCTNHNVTATGSGTSIDCRGYSKAMVTTITTTSSAASATFTLEESADDSTFTTVGTIGAVALSQTAYALTASIDLKERQRYLRVVYTAGGTPSMSILWSLTNPLQFPVVQTNGTVRL